MSDDAKDEAAGKDETKDETVDDTEPASESSDGDTVSSQKDEGAKRSSVTIPTWVAGLVAALVLLGAGFGIGWVSHGDGHDREGVERRVPSGRLPRIPGGGIPDGQFPGLPNGRIPGGGQTPQSSSGAFLGVAVDDVGNGARVTEVADGSPAADAGLKAGDVVTAVDGDSVTSASQLAKVIADHKPGDDVTITYSRDGSSSTAKVTLGDRQTASSGSGSASS
jgi:membrane-associated protease RseP (regulator of RpoE activity)